jgi:hypothetical protein
MEEDHRRDEKSTLLFNHNLTIICYKNNPMSIAILKHSTFGAGKGSKMT